MKKVVVAAITATEAKKSCPVSREQFLRAAKPLAVHIEGQLQAANVKEFSTGSLGWYTTGKVTVMVDGVPVTVQANVSLVVVGSKEAGK